MISVKNAPRALMIAESLKSAMFCIPVLMLYYGYKGVSQGDFFLIQGIAWLFVFVLEVPTGYIGDVFSRKITVILSVIAWILGYCCWIFGTGFWWVLSGELIFSIAVALLSGTIEAYLYDLLKRRGKEYLFHRKYAKMRTFEGLVLFLSTLCGSFMYQINPELPIWASVVLLIVSIAILSLLPDVPEARRKVEKGQSKIKDILSIAKFTVKHPHIKWLILYPSVYCTLTLIFMWGLQSVMIEREIPIFMFSIILALNSLGRTGWSTFSGKLLEKLGCSRLILLTWVVIITGITGACLSLYVPYAFVYVCLGMMIVASASSCLTNIATSTLVHYRIESDERSTVLSVKSMVSRACGGLGLIALKPLFDNVGVGETFWITSLLLIPILFIGYKLYRLHLDMVEIKNA